MKKIVVLAVLAAVTAAASPAEAKVRLRFNAWGVPYFEPYEPAYQRHWRRPVPPPDVYGSAYYDDYGDPAFDDSYYDPYYLPPSPKRLPLNKRKQAGAVAKSKPAVMAAKPSAGKPVTTAALGNTAKSTGGSGLSCDKANKVVAGYGFSSVTAKDCEGQVYEFAALRDGKKFTIKVSAASGELTEVKKID